MFTIISHAYTHVKSSSTVPVSEAYVDLTLERNAYMPLSCLPSKLSTSARKKVAHTYTYLRHSSLYKRRLITFIEILEQKQTMSNLKTKLYGHTQMIVVVKLPLKETFMTRRLLSTYGKYSYRPGRLT